MRKKKSVFARWGLSFEAASVWLATTNKRRITMPVDASDCLKRAWSKSVLLPFRNFVLRFFPKSRFALSKLALFLHLLLAIAEEHAHRRRENLSVLALGFELPKTPFITPSSILTRTPPTDRHSQTQLVDRKPPFDSISLIGVLSPSSFPIPHLPSSSHSSPPSLSMNRFRRRSESKKRSKASASSTQSGSNDGNGNESRRGSTSTVATTRTQDSGNQGYDNGMMSRSISTGSLQLPQTDEDFRTSLIL